MKRLIAIAMAVILLFVLMPDVYADEAQSWYCVRNKDHKQPIVGSDLTWVENYGGYYIDHAHGDDTEDKVVYLTFDAGYENGNVAKILDIMKEKQVTGAFFVLEHLVCENGELVSRMKNEGHLICNHTANHPDVTKLKDMEAFKKELQALEEVYRDKFGKEMSKYFRPPEGRFNRRSLEYAQKLGYKTIFWSFAYADWDNNSQMSVQAAKDKILGNIHNGAVILLHPTSDTNVAVLGDVIDVLKSQGYSFGSLDELTCG